MRIHPGYGTISDLPFIPGEIMGTEIHLQRVRVGDIITHVDNGSTRFYVFDPDQRISGESHWMADVNSGSRYGWSWVRILFEGEDDVAV